MKLLPLVIGIGLLGLASGSARASTAPSPGTRPKPPKPSDEDLINAAVVATQTAAPPPVQVSPKPPSSAPSSSTQAAPAAVRPPAVRPQVSPLPGASVAPVTPTGPNPTPAGYDPAKARATARQVAAHLAKKGRAGYSRDLLKAWQLAAALAPDGIYGGSSRGALIAYGVKDPPRPFFKPTNTIPYTPPEQRA